MSNARRQLRRVREELGKLDRFVGALQSVSGRRTSPRQGDVIELEEVSPGVFAAPTRRAPAPAGLLGELGSMLDGLEDLHARATELGGKRRG